MCLCASAAVTQARLVYLFHVDSSFFTASLSLSAPIRDQTKKKQPAQSAQDQRQGMRPPRAHGGTFDIFPASNAIKYPARRRPLFSSRDSPLDYSHVLGRLISPPDGCCCCCCSR
jgi:hypothetical protein